MAQVLDKPPQTDSTSSKRPIHSIILDTGPLINNTISISTIVGSAEQLYTTPAIISEIRDVATRSRVETTLMPFLTIKTPTPASYEAVSAFAKRTGDFAVLSRQDLGILALAYEVHCERHGGTFGLREEPGQPIKRTPEEEESERLAAEKRDEEKKKAGASRRERKASKPKAEQKAVVQKAVAQKGEDMASEKNPEEQSGEEEEEEKQEKEDDQGWETVPRKKSSQQKKVNQKWRNLNAPKQKAQDQAEGLKQQQHQESKTEKKSVVAAALEEEAAVEPPAQPNTPVETEASVIEAEAKMEEKPAIIDAQEVTSTETLTRDFSLSNPKPTKEPEPLIDSAAPTSESDDSDGDWITPSNLSKHKAKDNSATALSLTSNQPQIPVATMTTDYAMQNVLLQMNLNLLSPGMHRIRQIRSTILRCHACFLTTKEMSKQFCPRCGGATLARVTCSTDVRGVFKIHLSRNYQHNKRGDRYSVPKPVAGTTNGKSREKGGGQGGWGRELVLSEDQKEYTKQIDEAGRMTTRDLMDQDYLPGILTGDRGKAGGRPKVGAGRNINSKKRF